MGARVILKGQELTTLEKFNKTVGEISNLSTKDKSNLVNAINVLNNKMNIPLYYINTTSTEISSDFTELINEVVNEGKYQSIILIYSSGTTIRILESTLSMNTQQPNYVFRVVGDKGMVSDSRSTARGLYVHGNWNNNIYTGNVTNYLSRTHYLSTQNTEAFTPTSNYHPATKIYVDTAIANAISTSITSVLESEF